MSGSGNEILRATDISFSYRDAPVLNHVDLTLDSSQVVTVLGPNGSGKSTLLKILLGHLRGRGQVSWQNRAVDKWAPRELARLVAYLPQNPLIDESQTGGEVLALGRAAYWGAFGVETEEDSRAVSKVAARLQIESSLLNRRIDQLSGGQRQRILIARCLVQEPRVLLLDEPTNNLDLQHQLQLLNLLRELAHGENLAVLMIGHDINWAAQFSDRLILLHEGKKIAEGTPAEVVTADILERVYGVKMDVIEQGDRVPRVFPAGR